MNDDLFFKDRKYILPQKVTQENNGDDYIISFCDKKKNNFITQTLLSLVLIILMFFGGYGLGKTSLVRNSRDLISSSKDTVFIAVENSANVVFSGISKAQKSFESFSDIKLSKKDDSSWLNYSKNILTSSVENKSNYFEKTKNQLAFVGNFGKKIIKNYSNSINKFAKVSLIGFLDLTKKLSGFKEFARIYSNGVNNFFVATKNGSENLVNLAEIGGEKIVLGLDEIAYDFYKIISSLFKENNFGVVKESLEEGGGKSSVTISIDKENIKIELNGISEDNFTNVSTTTDGVYKIILDNKTDQTKPRNVIIKTK